MKNALLISLALAIVIAGCVQPPAENKTTDGEKKTDGRIVVDPLITRIEITSLPKTVVAGNPVVVKWELRGFAESTSHTAVHWGYASVASPSSPPDYPSATAYRYSSIPADLEDAFTPDHEGTVYLRAHTSIYGGNFWSDEKTITVTAPSTQPAALPQR